MAYKTIVTAVTDMEADRDALDTTIALARRDEAHLDILCLGLDRTEPAFFYAGASAVAVQTNMAQAQADARALEQALAARMAPEEIAFAIRSAALPMVALTPYLAHRMRLADVAVLPKPYEDGHGYETETIVEAALFNASVPVLIVPKGCGLPAADVPAVVAWNESQESLNAIKWGLPLLQQSAGACVAIIDPPAHGPDRSDPGGALCEMLSRHGCRVEVSVLARTMPRISDILCRHARDKEAGLMVMGAYGHSRFREAILGGATRSMLETAEIPVLMAH